MKTQVLASLIELSAVEKSIYSGYSKAAQLVLFVVGGTTCSRCRGGQEVEQQETSPIWFDWMDNTVHCEAKRDSSL